MSETQRCEPADPTKEQWGWLRTPTHGPVLCKWYEHNGVAGAWCWHYGGSRDGDINPAFISELGWTYVSAVPTPAEIAALVAAARKALDALLAREAGNVDELYSEPEETVLVDLINSLAAFPEKDTPHG